MTTTIDSTLTEYIRTQCIIYNAVAIDDDERAAIAAGTPVVRVVATFPRYGGKGTPTRFTTTVCIEAANGDVYACGEPIVDKVPVTRNRTAMKIAEWLGNKYANGLTLTFMSH